MADMTGDGAVSGSDIQPFIDRLNSGEDLFLQELLLRANYDESDWVIDGDDEDIFLDYYGEEDLAADLNGDGEVTEDDYDAFYAWFNFGIDLSVVT